MINSVKHNRFTFQGRRIGLIGLGPRNGTTHIALSTANYLSDCYKKKVCLIEQNTHNDFNLFREYLNIKGDSSDFTYHRVSYYPGGNSGESLSRLSSSYDCTVFDLGSSFQPAMATLELCDIRIAVGTGAPWRDDEYTYLEELIRGMDDLSSWILFINLGSEKQVKYYRNIGIPTYSFPLEYDPFCPHDATQNILTKALI